MKGVLTLHSYCGLTGFCFPPHCYKEACGRVAVPLPSASYHKSGYGLPSVAQHQRSKVCMEKKKPYSHIYFSHPHQATSYFDP